MIVQELDLTLVLVFFLYGLAFFSMGLAIILEGGRGSDLRLRLALRPLAGFGFLHALHEWIEMFEHATIPAEGDLAAVWAGIKIALLATSFLSLSGFGFSLLAPNLQLRRLSLLAPLGLAAFWGFGALIMHGRYPEGAALWHVMDVWTRYSLGITAAIAASVGLVAQQRAFRRAGMAKFGRDSLVASMAFAWYAFVGQLFVRPSRLPPSTFINDDLFFHWFRFPVQMLRAAIAVVVAIYVIRFLRAFDTEIKAQIASLQQTRVREAERREALRGELLLRIVTAQESERQRIARELHDETGQTLTALGMGLRGISASLKKDPQMAAHNLHKLEALATSSLDELQRIIANLRPSHLDDLGLSAALRWYIGQVQNHAGLHFNFESHGQETQFPEAVRIALFRIVQEAVTNIVKHAGAATAQVIVRYQADQVQIDVFDDGCGMEPLGVKDSLRPSWGLLGMQERVTLLQGKFTLESSPGEGVHICVCIPVHAAHANARREKESPE